MFLGNSEKKNRQGGVIGIDLDDRFAQISYWLPGAERPETFSQVMGGEDTMIPALMAFDEGKRQWLYGREAQRALTAQEALPAGRLLSLALTGQSVELEGGIWEGTALLAMFLQHCLARLEGALHVQKADMVMFTFERIEPGTVQMVSRLAALLSLSRDQVSCQSRGESFFYYNIRQPKELWLHGCILCDFGGQTLKTRLFEANFHTSPVTVTVKEREYPEVARNWMGTESPEERERIARGLGDAFADAARSMCSGRIIDTIYLIGDGFEGSWYQGALQILCAGRRVFRGSNLYSKGACYGARMKRSAAGMAKREYVYLGENMLKVNLGLEAARGGEAVCFSLLDAGMNWFDAKGECDFLLEGDRSFSLRLSPLVGKEVKEVIVTLDGVPERPPRTTRIHLTVSCPDGRTVKMRMEDKGFGELFPASGRVWEEYFPLVPERPGVQKSGKEEL